MNQRASHEWSAERLRRDLAAMQAQTPWAPDDDLGTVNYIGPDQVRRAASLVEHGLLVSCAQRIHALAPGGESGSRAHMFLWSGQFPGGPTPDAWFEDFIGLRPHGLDTTHVDALCHLSFDGLHYNRVADREAWSRGGPTRLGIDALAGRLVSRGVLIDVPKLTGRRWLEPGEAIRIADIEAAERSANLRVGEGDILLVRTGRPARKAETPPWDEFRASAGLHPEVADWLSARRVSMLGSDCANDLLPSPVAGVAMPIHVLCLVGMGMPLIDGADFEALADACAERERWDFMFMVPTLDIVRATASPVTPIAVL